ncbi:21009_t:CDS:2 [Gigaspora rosea]|nr:21009_t:CDS:2 [Gigaspora rosea]
MSRNKSKNKVISDDDNSYMENEDYTELSDIEKLSSIYSSDIDTEENFEVQRQEDLSKIHALEKQLEQMRRIKPISQNNVKLANKSSTNQTTQSNMKLTTQSNMELTTQSNMKLATKYGSKYSTKSTTTYIKLSKSNSKSVAKRQSDDIDWSSSDHEQDALRNCAECKILKNCDNITYRYTDPKLIESVIKKENNQLFPKTIGDWAIHEIDTNPKGIRVSPNEDVLDTDNNEQILNNYIFNVDQDEQESREEGEQENQDEQEQENLDKQEKVNQDEHEQVNQDEHEQANQDEHEQANQDEHEQENQDEVNQSSGNEIQTVTQNNKRQNNTKLTKKGLKNLSNNIVNMEPISEFTDNNRSIKAKNNNQSIKAKNVLKRSAKKSKIITNEKQFQPHCSLRMHLNNKKN